MKKLLRSSLLILSVSVAAAAQDPGTIWPDKTQPPPPPPPAPSTQTATASAEYTEDGGLLSDILAWLGIG